MRLLNVDTFEIEQFYNDVPRYAILSHTWGKDEVTFQQFGTLPKTSPRLSKAVESCRIAKSFKVQYIWIDTFCIDKQISVELSEALNSMFTWYKESFICLAYLSDVHDGKVRMDSSFRKSRWFTRGWTLQELIAPQRMLFLGSTWRIIGWRDLGWNKYMSEESNDMRNNLTFSWKGGPRDISEAISEVTGIGTKYLFKTFEEKSYLTATVGERMSWAAKRQTTRPEDLAYSLVGIFDINIPALYGEGSAGAFRRLQEEIVTRTHDLTIFAWGLDIGPTEAGILAESPSDFAGCGSLTRPPKRGRGRMIPYSVTNLGIKITVQFIDVDQRVCYVLFETVCLGDGILAIPMTWNEYQDDILDRSGGSIPFFVPRAWMEMARSKDVLILPHEVEDTTDILLIEISEGLRKHNYHVPEVYPPHAAVTEARHRCDSCVFYSAQGLAIVRYTNDTSSFFVAVFRVEDRWFCKLRGCNVVDNFLALLMRSNKMDALNMVVNWGENATVDLGDGPVEILVEQGDYGHSPWFYNSDKLCELQVVPGLAEEFSWPRN